MINEVVARLKSNAPALSDVKTAEEIGALTAGTAPKHGTAFVLPYREMGEPNTRLNGYLQLVHVQLLIAIVIRKFDDPTGSKRVADFDTLKSSVEGAIAGWQISADNEPFDLVSANSAPLGNGAVVYVQTWQTSRYMASSS